jgi:hypothetical protein
MPKHPADLNEEDFVFPADFEWSIDEELDLEEE